MCRGLFLTALALTSAMPADAWFQKKKAEISPHDLKIPYGEQIQLWCKVKAAHSSQLNSTFMSFRNNSRYFFKDATQEVVNSTTLQLTIKNATEEHNGIYFCYIGDEYMDSTTVYTGARPEPVTEIKCVSGNFDNMRCTFCPEEEPKEKTRWYMDWRRRGSWPPGSLGGNCTCNCLFDSGDFIQFSLYEMEVVAHNAYGTARTNFEIYTNQSMVKPSVVRNLRVDVVNSTTLNISWHYPIRLEPSEMHLQYSLHVQSQWGHDETIFVTEPTWIVNVSFVPDAKYNFTIRAKPLYTDHRGYWSDGVDTEIRMPEATPAEGPVLPTGAFRTVFRTVPCPNTDKVDCRKVYVFWQEVNPEKKHGVIQSYTVKATSLLSRTERDAVIDGDKYTASLALMRSEPYRISVTASTRVGESPPGYMYLPAAPTIVGPEYSAETTSDGKGLRFFIEENVLSSEAIDNYTLLHCLGNQGSRDSCEASPEVIYLPGNDTEFTLDQVTPGSVYSLSANSGTSSSGMTRDWLCIYAFDKLPGTPSFDVYQYEERSHTLQWERLSCDYKSNRGRVISFNVYWQDEDGEGGVVNLPSNVTRYTLTNLKPYHNYTFHMDAESKAGRGEATEKFTAPTLESAPDDPPQNVTVMEVGSSYVLVSWQPTPTPNGLVFYDAIALDLKGDEISKVSVEEHKLQTSVDNLNGFNDYFIVVRARNSAGESVLSNELPITTLIGAPSEVEVEVVNAVDGRSVNISWSRPDPANGPIDHYVVYIESLNTTYITAEEYRTVEIPCDLRKKFVAVSAVNIDADNRTLEGPLNEQKLSIPCSQDDVDLGVDIILVVCGVCIALTSLMAVLCFKCRRFLKAKLKLAVARPGKLETIPKFDSAYAAPLPEKNVYADLEKDESVVSEGDDAESSSDNTSSRSSSSRSAASRSSNTCPTDSADSEPHEYLVLCNSGSSSKDSGSNSSSVAANNAGDPPVVEDRSKGTKVTGSATSEAESVWKYRTESDNGAAGVVNHIRKDLPIAEEIGYIDQGCSGSGTSSIADYSKADYQSAKLAHKPLAPGFLPVGEAVSMDYDFETEV